MLFKGDMAGKTLVPVRVHSECLTSEVLGSLRCDCKTQLDMALAHLAKHAQDSNVPFTDFTSLCSLSPARLLPQHFVAVPTRD